MALEVENSAFEPGLATDKDDWDDTLRNAEGLVLTLLEEDGRIIGCSAAYPAQLYTEILSERDPEITSSNYDDTVAYSESFAIHKDYQGTGSVYSFLHERMEALKDAGYKTLILHARQSTMSGVLKHLGYTPKRTVKNWRANEDFDFYEIPL